MHWGATESVGQFELVLLGWVYKEVSMADKHPPIGEQTLDERFANDPVMRERMHRIADLRDQMIASGCSLDEVESRVVEQIRLLGQELFGGVAQAKADEAQAKARREHPEAIRDIKKSDLVHDSGRDQRRRRSFALGQARPAVAPFLPAHRHTAPGLFPSPATGHD
jgi:hypothetical protein